MRIKRKQLELEKEQLKFERAQFNVLCLLNNKLSDIIDMLEVKAVVKKRGGQIWKDDTRRTNK